MIFKLRVIVSSMLCSGVVFSQPIEPTPDYKYVLRIQREIESQIGYYLDEPKTGNLKKVHLESTKYLLLSEKNRKHKALSIQSEKVKKAVGQLVSASYDPNIVEVKNRYKRYHYFYIDEFSKD